MTGEALTRPRLSSSVSFWGNLLAVFRCLATSVETRFFSVGFLCPHVNLTWYYNLFSQALCKYRTLIFLKICIKQRGSTGGFSSALFLPWSELVPRIETVCSPMILISPFLPRPPTAPTLTRATKANLLPPTYFSLGQEIGFSRASSSSRCQNHFPNKPRPGSPSTNFGKPYRESKISP